MKTCAVIGCFIMLFSLAATASDSTPGVISTIAGNGTQGSSGDGGPATSAQLNGIADIAVDTAGNLYIAGSNAIRKVSPDGVISTVPGAPGGDIAVDAAGNIYVGRDDGIRMIIPAGAVISFADEIVPGNDAWGYLGGLVNDSAGNVYFAYVAAFGGTSIYKVKADGTVAVVGHTGGEALLVAVDSAGSKYLYDGSGVRKVGSATRMFSGTGNGFAVDGSGNLFISEIGENPRIWRVTPEGTTTVVAGNGTIGFSGDGGPATSAQLNQPTSVAVDEMGNILVGDSGNLRIRKITRGIDYYNISGMPYNGEDISFWFNFVEDVWYSGNKNGEISLMGAHPPWGH